MSLPYSKLSNDCSHLEQDLQAPCRGQQAPPGLAQDASPICPRVHPPAHGAPAALPLLLLKLPEPGAAMAPAAPFAHKGQPQSFVWFVPLIQTQMKCVLLRELLRVPSLKCQTLPSLSGPQPSAFI